MKYFSRVTKSTENSNKKNAVIMGRKTWESIPTKFRPLPGRLNLVISTQALKKPDLFVGAIACESFETAVTEASSRSSDIEQIWVIGGSSIYQAAFDSGILHRIYLTKILKEFECDTFLPKIDFGHYKLVEDSLVPKDEQVEGDIKYKYEVYEKTSK